MFPKKYSNLLFILVFITVENYYSLSMDSGSFVVFIAPGLIIMIVAQESYDNSSATLIHMKQIGSLDDWLMAPIYRIEILISLIFTSLIIGIILALFNFFIFNLGFKFRIIGATIFSILLSLSSWAFIQSYSEKVVIEGAKYVPIVYDNGFDLIIAKADDDFPEESIEPTLEQLSENLRKGSRSGANVKIKIRKLEKISDGISKPVVIGEVQKNVKMN